MKLTTHHLRAGAALLLAGILLAGCDQSSSDEKHIKVGVINGAEQDVAKVAKKVAKEKYGLDVELVGFSGSLLPNDATNHGELDANRHDQVQIVDLVVGLKDTRLRVALELQRDLLLLG